MSRKDIDSRTAGVAFGAIAITATVAMVLIFRSSLPFEFHRDHPKYTLIISNLKQVAYALRNYAADWDDKLPPDTKWVRCTAPYIQQSSILTLPTADAENPHRAAFNSAMSGVPLDLIELPTQTVLVFEADSNSASPAGDQSMVTPYSNDKMTVLAFADGSMKRVEMSRLREFRWKPVLASRPLENSATKFSVDRKPRPN